MKNITPGLILFFFIICFSCQSQEKIVFEEHFSDNSRKWNEEDKTDHSTKVLDNKLFFHAKYVRLSSFEWLPWDSLSFDKNTQFSIECSTLWSNGKNDWGYGIFWGNLDKYSFYFFEIASSGYYGFGIQKKGKDKMIVDWTPCDKVNKQGNNLLKMKVLGNSLMLYVNDQLISQISYSPINIDCAGFINTGDQTILFDDLIIKKF